MPEVINRGLGWRPDLPDVRDEKFAFRTALKRELKPAASLPPRLIVPWHYSKNCTKAFSAIPVDDQSTSSSCTGQSTGTMIDQMSGWVKRSKLQLYYGGRQAIGETGLDNGAYIRDVIKHAADVGAASESSWPFSLSRITRKPSSTALTSAKKHKVTSYHRLQSRQDFLSCLAEGYAFVIGFTCYLDFVSTGSIVDRYGILNYPNLNQSNYGGHAVCVIGYDNDFRNSAWGQNATKLGIEVPETVYIVRNSWGKNWGRSGDFAVDSNYFENTNLADDAWTVRITKNSS